MEHSIEIRKLSKKYKNGFLALDEVDLFVDEGDFFALLGPNGAGKSTFIGIVSSLINKTSGSVSVYGYDIDKQRHKVKQMLGIVPQEFNLSAFEKCIDILTFQGCYYGLSRRASYDSACTYLKALDLWDKRDTISRRLSGGMKRRLMIARALIHRPKLLILDEPTAGVDIEIRRSMWDFLTELNNNGTTIILTTHYLEEAEQLCRHVAIIDQGKLVEKGRISNIVSNLKAESFILSLASSLDKFPEEKECPFTLTKRTADSIEIQVDNTTSINDVFLWLNKHNIAVSSMKNKSNRLEALFIQMLERKQSHS